MRRFFLGAALLLSSFIPAVGQEFDWTRYYAGGFAGLGGGSSTFFAAPAPTPQTTFEMAGPAFGLLAGMTFDAAPLVIGLEGEFGVSAISGASPCFGSPITCRTSMPFWFAAKGRVGAPTPFGLVYAMAGLVVGQVRAELQPAGSPNRVDAQLKAGYTAGVGIELPIAERMTVGAEYAFTDLGKLTSVNTLAPVDVTATSAYHSIRLSVRYTY
jgi:opacity protein-like surface antigen